MSPDELTETIKRLRSVGTDLADVEAKRAATALPRSVRETISAFQNTTGGTLVLGLDEAAGFAAVGVDDPAKIASDLASLCSDAMEPPARPLIQIMEHEGAHLVVAEVAALDPGQRPSHYRGEGMLRSSYLRVNDGDHRMTGYEVQMVVASRGQPVEDRQPVPETSPADLDPRMVAAYLERLRRTTPSFSDLDDARALRRARVVVDTDQGPRLTLAGLLALGSYPQEHQPQLFMSFVSYPTTTGADLQGTRFLDNASLDGPVPLMVRDALAVVRRNMSRRAVVVGAGRTDVWDYPEAALREVLTNALVHRDLSPGSRGAQVQVEMYPDRIEVRNPGGLFGPVSVDDLEREGVSTSRNAVLLRILEDVAVPGEDRTVCENRGSGLHVVRRSLRDAGMGPPRFQDAVAWFKVTLTRSGAASGPVVVHDRLDPTVRGGRVDRRAQLLAALGDVDRSRSELAVLLGLSDQVVQRWLRVLRDEGRVETVGSTSPRSPLTRYSRIARDRR